VSRARRFVAKALTGHPAAAIVALLVSELATNAVVHARSRFEITVRLALGRIRVEVSDGSPWLPRPRQSWATADRENGRGLHLVERLSSQWGATATTDGKVVWFEVA
jgi:anti-sigma regulatory factor (Ser/Thr protein kinase)